MTAKHASPGRKAAAAPVQDDPSVDPKEAVTERLLAEARKKTERLESPRLAKAALIVAVAAVVVSWISIAGWVLGTIALTLGVPRLQSPDTSKMAKVAVLLGAAALVVATFSFSLALARRR